MGTMRAGVVRSFDTDLEVGEVDIPSIGEHEALDFFARGLIAQTCTTRPLDDINAVFAEMLRGEIDGRVVLDMRG